jgi:hypothetical protein
VLDDARRGLLELLCMLRYRLADVPPHIRANSLISSSWMPTILKL